MNGRVRLLEDGMWSVEPCDVSLGAVYASCDALEGSAGPGLPR